MDFLIFANTTINTQSYLIHMKRFILPLLIIILILTSLPTKANNEIESLLKTLDKSLQHKSVYTKQKQRQIDSLKIVLRQSDNIQEKIGIAQSLCFEYSSFQKDSALVYAIHMNNLAQKSNDKELLIEAKLDYSRILSSMGFFKEALAIVNSTQQEQLSPRLKAEYFLGQVTIYNHQKTFASNENDAQENDLIAQIYRDSLLQCKEVPSNVRAFMSAPTLLFHKKYDNAIHILDSVYKSYAPYSRDAGIIAYSLASAYQGKNDSENMIKYFAISAISDVLNGARENLSLKILAKLIFESGDIDRAYKYMKNKDHHRIFPYICKYFSQPHGFNHGSSPHAENRSANSNQYEKQNTPCSIISIASYRNINSRIHFCQHKKQNYYTENPLFLPFFYTAVLP